MNSTRRIHNQKKYGYVVPFELVREVMGVLQQLTDCKSGNEDWPRAEKLRDELEKRYGRVRG